MGLRESRHRRDCKKDQQPKEAGEGLLKTHLLDQERAVWQCWHHWRLLHVHDPSLIDVEESLNPRLNCKLLQQIMF
jgi:hypothetical protein